MAMMSNIGAKIRKPGRVIVKSRSRFDNGRCLIPAWGIKWILPDVSADHKKRILIRIPLTKPIVRIEI
jgi:hypothetical protein